MAELRLLDVSNTQENPMPIRHVTRTFADGDFARLGTGADGGLLRLIAGVERMESGTIFLGGRKISGLPAPQRRVGILFARHPLYLNRTAAENLRAGLRISASAAAEAALAFGAERLLTVNARELTAEQRLYVGLARLLLQSPEVILLETPLRFLPAPSRPAAWSAIRRLHALTGATVLCSMSAAEKEILDFTADKA